MTRIRGFVVGRRMVKAFKWFIRPRKSHAVASYQLRNRWAVNCNPISKIVSLARHLRRGAKRICCPQWSSGYVQEERELLKAKPVSVPKGHLAVYVGEPDDDQHRILVPVIYFNHPLFGELLKEAEKAYGFNHPGGITIPCRISEFEKVKTRIASGDKLCRRPMWKGR